MEENKVEEFVEEVKEDVAEAVEEVKEDVAETAEETKDVFAQAKAGFKSFIDKVAAIDLNKDGKTVGTRVEELGKAAKDVVNTAAEKFNEVKEDPKTGETLDKAKETFNNVTSTVSNKVKDVVNSFRKQEEPCCEKPGEECCCEEKKEAAEEPVNAEEAAPVEEINFNEEVKKMADTITEKAKVASEYASDKYQEFIHDENVRKTVRTARDFVVGLAGKVKDALEGKNEVTEETPEENTEEE